MLVRGVVTTAMVFAIGLTACSGSTSSTRQSTTTQHSVPQNLAADMAAAEAAALKLSDLPSGGWASNAATDSPDSPAVNAQLATCVGVNETELESGPAHFQSPAFSDSHNHTVSNSVSYMSSAAVAQHQFALFKDAKMPACLGTVISNAIKNVAGVTDTITFGTPTVMPLSFPTVGDHTIAYRVTIATAAASRTATAGADFLVAVEGRVRVEMNFETVDTPYRTDQERHYLETVLRRLTNT